MPLKSGDSHVPVRLYSYNKLIILYLLVGSTNEGVAASQDPDSLLSLSHIRQSVLDGTVNDLMGRKISVGGIANTPSGLPDDFSPDQADSLGMMLVDTFTTQLDADMEISQDNGTTFRIRIKAEGE